MIFEVKNGSFAYHLQIPVLQNISFGINQGDILAILGGNGAGKTTLLKCMLGFLKWQKGESYFEEHPQQSIKNTTFFQKVAYVPQAHAQTFPCSVKETVLMGRSAYLGMFASPDSQDEQYAMEAMKMCGILDLQDANINEISGGQMQLAYIARALCTNPEVIVLDEAETGLDYANQQIILHLLKQLAEKKGKTVIFNTHYPDHALRIANKTLLLQKDGTALFGNTSEILNEDNLKKTFGIDISMKEIEINGQIYHSLIPLEKR